ncbi:WXG100 family type VII secretion target [Lapillicoccus sp.]|uniref:WXG100 family type VII secretion target n=1 Tax=Lapillicoccus sp. TaxID=1909287 RepID=UPI0025D0B2B2|nr:WXG100 family type VII secretion target [Lapillicoccus sp.]
MSSPTQQQQVGAQRAAAGKIRGAEGSFQQQLRRLRGESDALRPAYQGPASSAFFGLIDRWLLDAEAIVTDMQRFAATMDRQESEVNAQQDASAATYSRAATRLATRA